MHCPMTLGQLLRKLPKVKDVLIGGYLCNHDGDGGRLKIEEVTISAATLTLRVFDENGVKHIREFDLNDIAFHDGFHTGDITLKDKRGHRWTLDEPTTDSVE